MFGSIFSLHVVVLVVHVDFNRSLAILLVHLPDAFLHYASYGSRIFLCRGRG